jgi:hypothetical protein
MASYYLTFRCDVCGENAVHPIIGVNTYRQEELFSPTEKYPASCKNGHQSIYFLAQLLQPVPRKLTPLERETEPELLGDDRFVDIE